MRENNYCYIVVESFRDEFEEEEQNNILYITTNEEKAQKFYDNHLITTPLKKDNYEFYDNDNYSFYGFNNAFDTEYYELRIIKKEIEF